ncbi:YlqD family protein [Halobacillus yeomjeoni]|uniref:YlqD family protein n=1 Tax=Halobacillus yeomjeoni TaxID=311194 RepID=A0A931HTT5_9BACI|nr:YlqD family protein [Halobacillus yeomjeoni]MBH0229249.1 YlqD family protein [Halobacillus yeomjeoni]MCA0983352.1 YlqD family protein [Halobacillus yeomjeoni]
MQIIRKIPVKQILTQSSRAELKDRFDERIARLDRECRQLSFEQKKLERKPGVSRQEVERRFSKEISRRRDQMRWIEYQLNQLEILPDGSELETDEVDALIEVNEGDSWNEMIRDQQMIIKDGIVIRAR